MRLEGKPVADKIIKEVKASISLLIEHNIKSPCLAVIQVGNDPRSSVYVKNKEKEAKKAGIISETIKIDEKISKEDLIKQIQSLNESDKYAGILIQLPLPQHLKESEIIEHLSPIKDVDGIHPDNLGKLMRGTPYLTPCTPTGVIEILKYYKIEISGKKCLIIGRSNIVGKPLVFQLLQENATVTIAHSKTQSIEDEVKKADILFVAIGQARFIRGSWVKDGSTVIDVGINSLTREDWEKKGFPITDSIEADFKKKGYAIVGDTYFEELEDKVSAITPVPGGVGLLTVAVLMNNTLKAYIRQKNLENHLSEWKNL